MKLWVFLVSFPSIALAGGVDMMQQQAAPVIVNVGGDGRGWLWETVSAVFAAFIVGLVGLYLNKRKSRKSSGL